MCVGEVSGCVCVADVRYVSGCVCVAEVRYQGGCVADVRCQGVCVWLR